MIKKLLFLLLISQQIWAQPDIWQHYHEQNSGLPNNTIRAIAIDAQNRKWVGTDNGLAVYNDTVWTSYNTVNSGLTDNNIRAICPDHEGNMWVGTTTGGVFKFDGNVWTNYNPANSGIPDYFIRCIAVDSVGDKWIGTVEGLARFDDVNWRVWTIANGDLFSNNITSIAIGKQNEKIIGTINGGAVYMPDTTTEVCMILTCGIPDNSMVDIDLDSTGMPWYASPAGGLFVDWGGHNWQDFNAFNSPLPNNALMAIVADEAWHRLYLATEQNGLVRYDITDTIWSNYTTTNSLLPDNHLICVEKDRDGLLWLGTRYSGLVSLQEGVSGVKNANQETPEIQVFPNPAAQMVYVQLNGYKSDVDYFLYNNLGQVVLQATGLWGEVLPINVSALQNGTYFLRVRGVGSRKIIVDN